MEDRRKGRVQEQAYTVKDVTAAIQQAAKELGEPLHQREYEAWRKEGDRPHPSKTAIIRIAGFWSEACEAAGVECG